MLEDAGVLSWVQRIKRVRVRCPDLFGDADGVRVVAAADIDRLLTSTTRAGARRASNLNKKSGSAPKSEKPTGTSNQVLFAFLGAASGGNRTARVRGRKEASRGSGRKNPYQRLARKNRTLQAIASMATEAPLRVLAGRN